MDDTESDAHSRLTHEIRDRWLGLEGWLATRPEGVPYGLAIVPRSVYLEHSFEMYSVDDDEMRIRARSCLPKDRCGPIDGVLVVACLW